MTGIFVEAFVHLKRLNVGGLRAPSLHMYTHVSAPQSRTTESFSAQPLSSRISEEYKMALYPPDYKLSADRPSGSPELVTVDPNKIFHPLLGWLKIDVLFGLEPEVMQPFIIRVDDAVFGSRPEDTKGDHILVGHGKFYVSRL